MGRSHGGGVRVVLLTGLGWISGCGGDGGGSGADAGADARSEAGGLSDDPREDFDVAAHYQDVEPCVPDDDAPVPERESHGRWVAVELPGARCSDGSPYKFFVSYSSTRNDVAVMFEPGGACWDYASCAGMTARGAANPHGIPDDHMDTWGVAYPVWADLPLGDQDGAPLALLSDYNRVFLPYCTGDVFAGDATRTYESEDGDDALTYRHVGQRNMQAIVPWLDATFPEVPRLVVGGCSAGGAGALIHYHALRSGMKGTQCGYLVSDSGPLFSSFGPSAALHAQIREAWGVDTTLDVYRSLAEALYGAPGAALLDQDMGAINDVLALTHPADRLAVTLYRWDFNYSLYSYDTFFDAPSDARIFDLWGEDVDSLVAQYARYPNLATYVAHARSDNCSHCLTLAPLDHLAQALAGMPYLGTEIEADGVDLHDFYRHVLADDEVLESRREVDPPAGEGLSPEETAACR